MTLTPKDQSDTKLNRIDYSLRRFFVDEFHFQNASALTPHSKILDLGGHKTRKRGRFNIEHYNLKVTYADLSNTKKPDVQIDAAYIPFCEGCFDVVICSELLEHVFNPPAVLREAHRILCENGILLMCVPFLYRIHGDPYDFGRYTDHYWQTVLQQIGFREILIERQGLFFSVIVDFMKQYATETLWRRQWLHRFFCWAIIRGQWWALKMEQKPSVQQQPFLQSFTTGFGIRARKG